MLVGVNFDFNNGNITDWLKEETAAECSTDLTAIPPI